MVQRTQGVLCWHLEPGPGQKRLPQGRLSFQEQSVNWTRRYGARARETAGREQAKSLRLPKGRIRPSKGVVKGEATENGAGSVTGGPPAEPRNSRLTRESQEAAATRSVEVTQDRAADNPLTAEDKTRWKGRERRAATAPREEKG